MCLFKQKLRPILRWLCAFKSSGSMLGLVSKFSDAVMAIFSGQSVISRVYTSRLGNGTDRFEPRPRWYENSIRYQVQYPVENPLKLNRTVLNHAVEKRQMIVFWTIAKSAVFPIIVVSKNKRYPEFILYGWSFIKIQMYIF